MVIPATRGAAIRRRLRRVRHPAWFRALQRTTPLSEMWGFDRGLPVDRYYIEQFLEQHRQDVRGHVLEVHDRAYIDRFGSGVERADVLDIDEHNVQATIVADLARAHTLDGSRFDCFILTQTLHLIYDTRAAIRQAHRLLRPGGRLLATVPAVSRVGVNVGVQGDYWRFTAASCRVLFGEVFGTTRVEVHSYGNVLAAIAFLSGMAADELPRRKLDVNDPYFPVVVAVRAVKE